MQKPLPCTDSIGVNWASARFASCKLDCVCSSDLFSSPAECHVVAEHHAGSNDRLHSNLPETQQDETSSQLLFCLWSWVSRLLLFFFPSSFQHHLFGRSQNWLRVVAFCLENPETVRRFFSNLELSCCSSQFVEILNKPHLKQSLIVDWFSWLR